MVQIVVSNLIWIEFVTRQIKTDCDLIEDNSMLKHWEGCRSPLREVAQAKTPEIHQIDFYTLHVIIYWLTRSIAIAQHWPLTSYNAVIRVGEQMETKYTKNTSTSLLAMVSRTNKDCMGHDTTDRTPRSVSWSLRKFKADVDRTNPIQPQFWPQKLAAEMKLLTLVSATFVVWLLAL